MDDSVMLERVIDLPRVIVWDALVDPVLVEGWLHPTARLVDATEVHELLEPGLLAVTSPVLGDVRFELAELPGGTRGTSTRLRVRVTAAPDPRIREPLMVSWLTRLDQLDDLLRGHPVDWQAVPSTPHSLPPSRRANQRPAQ